MTKRKQFSIRFLLVLTLLVALLMPASIAVYQDVVSLLAPPPTPEVAPPDLVVYVEGNPNPVQSVILPNGDAWLAGQSQTGITEKQMKEIIRIMENNSELESTNQKDSSHVQ